MPPVRPCGGVPFHPLTRAVEGAYGAFLVTDFNKACNCDPNKEIAHGRALIGETGRAAMRSEAMRV